MTEQETHQGAGVYGGWETHRGTRHACPAPDCGPTGNAFEMSLPSEASPKGDSKDAEESL